MDNQLHKTISEIWQSQYVVPLYQRNFAWMEEQIRQLLQDIYDHRNDVGNYYLGSLVVLERNDGTFEIIDGQQRLTALQIICKELGILSEPRLNFDSRPEVEDFFNDLFKSSSCKSYYDNLKGKNSRKTFRLHEALKIITDTKIRTGEEQECSIKDFSHGVKEEMKEFLANKVILITTPLPQDTDVAAYFEIMNNRGEQLQPHEVIKALLMSDPQLDAQKREIISTVWNACSEMDLPIQRTLSTYRRDKINGQLFGEDFNTLKLEFLQKYNIDATAQTPMSIDEILNLNVERIKGKNNDVKEEKYKSIIDFPNFLTHVFRLYNDDVELNGDKLRKGFEKIRKFITDPMEFTQTLLTVRVLFDRYVVKLQAENEEDENLNWILHRPYLKKNSNDNDNLRYKNTFSKDNNDESDGEEDSSGQKRIVKQLSMLQVSFRNQKYKNWLFAYLKWLIKNYGANVETVKYSEIIRFLDDWIENYYSTYIQNKYIDKETGKNLLLNLGVETPHFLFNYIDYLYWLESLQEPGNIRHRDEVTDFKFKYYNSVEHHRPQSYTNDDLDIDSIGNLCLISRRNNSSLNLKDAREKAKTDLRGLQPKRKIMYKITQVFDWDKKQIQEHHNDIEQLLTLRKRLLNMSSPEI